MRFGRFGRACASTLLAIASFASAAFASRSASAQPAIADTATTGSLERFSPSAAGDAMFGVASPSIGGHLVPRAKIVADYAYLPLSIQDGGTRYAIVSQQTFLHLNASISLFEKLLFSFDMPFALAQGGDSPTVGGVPFNSPSSAEIGDLRLGVRFRFLGKDGSPFQIAVGGNLFVPTSSTGSYAGDGALSGEPYVALGGRAGRFVYTASLGATMRGSSRPDSFDGRAGFAAIFGKNDFFQIGPELYLSTPFSKEVLVDTINTRISVASAVSAEAMLGAKLRPLPFLVVGAGAGPGLTQGWGTPVFMAVGSVGYEPQADPVKEEPDTDRDEIVDRLDSCPKEPGVPSSDPLKNGCPPDRDGDKIVDAEDACVTVPGQKSDDPKKNGCPPDRDGDKIVDEKDACPDEPGEKNADPAKNGCPPDRDGDSIRDKVDACPDEPGVADPDPAKNGCAPDRDGDKIKDPVDACPDEPGVRDEDPSKNGCPLVSVTNTEIVIHRQVRFRFAQSKIDYTIDPVSDDLLTEVRDALVEHPEIEMVEVQGHADSVGTETFNQELSQGRADAVRAWLIKKGIAPEKLIAKGYGTTAPIADNESVKGRQANRRVQFVIIKKKSP